MDAMTVSATCSNSFAKMLDLQSGVDRSTGGTGFAIKKVADSKTRLICGTG
jgi:hypothetical protein